MTRYRDSAITFRMVCQLEVGSGTIPAETINKQTHTHIVRLLSSLPLVSFAMTFVSIGHTTLMYRTIELNSAICLFYYHHHAAKL